MRYLIVSDVFGRTKAIEEIASGLSDTFEIIDPYNSKLMNFENETEAYKYFISSVSLERYTENLENKIQSYTENLCLIGFSVGASAIWKLSSLKNLKQISHAVCFYGSQIRHNKHIYPTFPVQLIFPAKEEHFSVADLINELSNRENVESIKTPYLHGFMNSHSENFNQFAYDQYIQNLISN